MLLFFVYLRWKTFGPEIFIFFLNLHDCSESSTEFHLGRIIMEQNQIWFVTIIFVAIWVTTECELMGFGSLVSGKDPFCVTDFSR